MRLSVLPIPLTLALLCTPSTNCLARSSSSTSLEPILSSLDLQTPYNRLESTPRLLRVKRQGTTGGGTQSGAGDSTTGGDTAAAGGTDTTQASASAPADTATTPAETSAQQQTTSQPVASTPDSTTQQTTQQQPTTTSPTTTRSFADALLRFDIAAADTSSTTQAQQPTQTQQTSSQTTNSPTATTPTASVPTTSSASSEFSASSASSDSSASSSSLSTFEVTFTSTFTNADGSVGVSTGTLQSASAVPIKQNNSSNAGKVWGIVGGVVGGIVVILAGAFLIYRMTQRRFSNLDDNIDEIRWPELSPDSQTVSTNTSTLRPLDTHRTGGAGIGDDGDDWDSSEPFMAPGGAGGGAGGDRRFSSGTLLSMSQNAHDASYEQLAMVDQGGYPSQQSQGHYDPFLGPSSAPYPPPQNVYPPSPYNSSPSLNGSPNLMGSSSDLRTVPMGAPGAGGAIREGSPPPRDMFAASDGFRSQHSPSPHNHGGNYRGGPL
ncbi:hypothetical protein JCM5350_004223 [Sporobolomyces pararoseus]